MNGITKYWEQISLAMGIFSGSVTVYCITTGSMLGVILNAICTVYWIYQYNKSKESRQQGW